MKEKIYNFTPEIAFKTIESHWKAWDAKINPAVYAVGLSGGIDSTCVASLACKLFGKDRVLGISLPCNGQSDMEDVNKVFSFLGIRRMTIDIGDMFNLGLNAIENQAIDVSEITRTNMPARLRMVMLYGIAQSVNGIVVNTCQRSEDILGWNTLFGDDCGSYAPIKQLTKTEVRALAAWLGAPKELVEKTPIDGLQPYTDEEKLGITYAKVDDYIRSTGPVSIAEEALILDKFIKNKFKLEMVNLPGPKFDFLLDRIRAAFNV